MHILVAFDRSTESDNALVNALDVIDALGGTVTAVHAAEDADPSTEAGAGVERAEAILEEAVDLADRHDTSIETEVLAGEPIDAISEYAESTDVDAIYVGHRGFSSDPAEFPGGSRGPLGSIAKGLVEATEVPVTVYDRGL